MKASMKQGEIKEGVKGERKARIGRILRARREMRVEIVESMPSSEQQLKRELRRKLT